MAVGCFSSLNFKLVAFASSFQLRRVFSIYFVRRVGVMCTVITVKATSGKFRCAVGLGSFRMGDAVFHELNNREFGLPFFLFCFSISNPLQRSERDDGRSWRQVREGHQEI